MHVGLGMILANVHYLLQTQGQDTVKKQPGWGTFLLKDSIEGVHLSPAAPAAALHQQVLEKVPDAGGKAPADFHSSVTFWHCAAAASRAELRRASPSPSGLMRVCLPGTPNLSPPLQHMPPIFTLYVSPSYVPLKTLRECFLF